MVSVALFKDRSDHEADSPQRRRERRGHGVDENHITGEIIDSAVAVHRYLGPGLLESAYVAALGIEFEERGLVFVQQTPVQGYYHGKPLGLVYRADLLIENRVLVEVKAVQRLEEIHVAQILSYLRLGRWKVGLLLNFHSPLMKNGIRRIVNTNDFSATSAFSAPLR
jgi:GxxExxY protein